MTPGHHVVVYEAKDKNGNAITCTFTVYIAGVYTVYGTSQRYSIFKASSLESSEVVECLSEVWLVPVANDGVLSSLPAFLITCTSAVIIAYVD